MATFTIKTHKGFDMTQAFALSNQQIMWADSLQYFVKDSVSGMTHRWVGEGFTYDVDGNITGGNANRVSIK